MTHECPPQCPGRPHVWTRRLVSALVWAGTLVWLGLLAGLVLWVSYGG